MSTKPSTAVESDAASPGDDEDDDCICQSEHADFQCWEHYQEERR